VRCASTSFADTRARRGDPDTSHLAARNATSHKADMERAAILASIRERGPSTAREIAAHTGIDYFEVQRRISEVGLIRKTEQARDGCKVWEAA
jgi:hypothetical protein